MSDDVSPGRVEGFAAERLLSWVRGVGLVFAVPSVATTPYFPNPTVRAVIWVLLGLFAAGTVAIWVLDRRPLAPRGRARLTLGALLFDIAVVGGFVLAFAYEDPNVTWSLLVTLPVDGAVRYGWRGAVPVAVGANAIFVAYSLVRAPQTGEAVSLSAHFYVVALMVLVTGVTSVLVETYRRQSVRYRLQAAELATAHQVRDRLMAVVSHEIRGSLAAVGASASLLREKRHQLDEARVDRMLGAAERQVDHLLVLVDDLLVTGRGGEEGLDLTPRWGDLATTVQLAVAAAERFRRGHLLDTRLDAVRCELDHERVQQVVRNLVENAFKYSPAESAVTVTARRSPTGVVLTVADQGPGIEPEVQVELFKPFQRGTDAESTEGIGLGLYVVNRIVAACDGGVEIRSTEGSTEFVVSLPCPTEPVDTDLAEAQRRTRQ